MSIFFKTNMHTKKINQPPGGTTTFNVADGYGHDDHSVIGAGKKKGRLEKVSKEQKTTSPSHAPASPRSALLAPVQAAPSPANSPTKKFSSPPSPAYANNDSASQSSGCSSLSSGGKSRLLADSEFDRLRIVSRSTAVNRSPNASLGSATSSSSSQLKQRTVYTLEADSDNNNIAIVSPKKQVRSLAEIFADSGNNNSEMTESTREDSVINEIAAAITSYEEAVYAHVSTNRVTARGMPNYKLSPSEYAAMLKEQIALKATIAQSTSPGSNTEEASTKVHSLEGIGSQYVDDNCGRRKPSRAMHPMSIEAHARLANSDKSAAIAHLESSHHHSPIDKILIHPETGESRSASKIYPTRRHDSSQQTYVVPFAHGDDQSYRDSHQLSLMNVAKRGAGSPRGSTIVIG